MTAKDLLIKFLIVSGYSESKRFNTKQYVIDGNQIIIGLSNYDSIEAYFNDDGSLKSLEVDA